jgi:hypothetical protein
MTLILGVALLAMPSFAAAQRRHPSDPPFTIVVTGTVTDATTSKPVASAEVSLASSNNKVSTDAEGKYRITVPGSFNANLTAARSGYTSATKTVNSRSDTTLNFTLQPTATASVREVNGTVTQVDAESFKFAYLIPFSGYAATDTANFCLADGTQTHPDRSEISKIVGPATAQTGTKCCNIGPVMSMQVTFKNGSTQTVYLTDSCFGNEVDVLGRNHATGQFVYFNLANVAEVTLP